MTQESPPRILVAASASITAEKWVESGLKSVLTHSDASIKMFGRNDVVLRQLESSGQEFTAVFQDGKCSKSELRRLISEIDFLLLLWDGVEHTKILFEARLQSKKIKLVPIEITTVVNKEKTDDFDIYIGRGTPFGNPYPVGEKEGQYTREEAVALYKRDFELKMQKDVDFKRGILGLKGYRLGCFCKPFECHGDVIANYLNSQIEDFVSES